MQIDRSSRDPMERFGTIAGRPDPVDLGSLVVIDGYRPGRSQRDPGIFGKADLWSNPQCQHHQVGGKAAVVAPDAGHGSTRPGNALDLESGLYGDPHRPHVVGHELRHVWIEGAFQYRRHHGHYRRADTNMVKGLGDLEPDVATTDDNGALDSGHDQRPQSGRIVEGPEHMDPLEVHAFDGRADGGSAGCIEQLVVSNEIFAARVTDGDGVSLEIDRRDLMVDPGVDASSLELLGGADLQIVEILDPTTHEIRLSAGRETDISGLFEYDDVEIIRAAHPACLTRRGHTCRVASDDYQSFCHYSILGPLSSVLARRRLSSSRSPRTLRFRRRMIRPIISSMRMATSAVISMTMMRGAAVSHKNS